MGPKKVEAIVEWPSLRNIYEVRSFHGLESFYRKFMNNFSNICTPIVHTIKTEYKPFEWTKAVKRGFMLLKQKITKKLLFAFLEFQKLFEVKCDASGMAIGDVLSQ